MSSEMFYEGLAGRIEVAIDWPKDMESIKGWALVLHPHPLFDGANTNKVVTTIARAVTSQGYVAVRPNFRGVGQSQGQFDEAHGETLDMLQLIPQLFRDYPQWQGKPWVLAGFSFGTAVATQLYTELTEKGYDLPHLVFLAGTAAWRFQYRDLVLNDSFYLVHGQLDDVVPLGDCFTWAQGFKHPVTVLTGAGHFFHGFLPQLKQQVLNAMHLYNLD